MLPELTRIMWASAHARDVWEPRIQAVSQAWQAAELESVAQGLRTAALTSVASELLPEMMSRTASRGLALHVVGQVARSGSYSVTEHAPIEGQPWDYRAFVIDPRALQLAQQAWATVGPERDERIGALLGFPPCCRQFFRRVWVEQQLRDTTFSMGPLGTAGPPECNILLRWLGVRLVPHLPCSFTCAAAEQSGKRFATLLPELERRWAYELLGWPMRWTAKNGIAELETPCFKVNMTTDVSSIRLELRREGHAPREGATGIRFPYNQPCAEAIPARLVDKTEWTDNGFQSLEAMDAAHQMVLDALRQSPPDGYVIDLGAGNGQLLLTVKKAYPLAFVGGIESDAKKAAKNSFISCDDLRKLLKSDSEFHTLIVSRRRFEEIPGLEDWCLAHSHQVICYSYDAPMGVEVLHGTVHAH